MPVTNRGLGAARFGHTRVEQPGVFHLHDARLLQAGSGRPPELGPGPPALRDENPSSDTGGPASLSSRVVQCTWPTQPRPPSVERHHTGRYVNAVAVLAP